MGLLFLIVFLMPGFLSIIEVRRKLPLFAAGQTQTEFVMWSSLAGLACHVILVIIGLLAYCVVALLSDKVGFSSMFGKTVGSLTPSNMKNIKMWYLLIGFFYCILALAMGKLVGHCLTRIFMRPGFGIVDLRPSWVDAFSSEQANFVRAHLDDGYIVTGIVESIQSDLNSLVSGNRDIVISSAYVFNPNGIEQTDIAGRITINTRNIKMLQIAN